MAKKSVTETYTHSSSQGTSQSHTASRSESQSQSATASRSETRKTLDEALLSRLLAGLTGNMTDAEIASYAENLLRPQLDAGLEAARQRYETTELSKKQEIENLAASLARSIEAQQSAYRQSAADVENAALARGMGRSSYTLETLRRQGDALAEAVRQLTDENARQSGQIQAQITQAAQQSAQTQGRLNTDYAAGVAAKEQELRENRRKESNANYLTAISSAMGQRTTGEQQTAGTQRTNASSDTQGSESRSSSGYTSTTTASAGAGRSGTKTTQAPEKEAEQKKETAGKVIHGRYSPGNTSKIR